MEKKEVSTIYIPVWCDLNAEFCFILLTNSEYLHSSMVRFESFPYLINYTIIVIYIPVWCDLNPRDIFILYSFG